MRDPIRTAECIQARADELRARSSALIAEGSLCLAECIRELGLGPAPAAEHVQEAERHFEAAFEDEYGRASAATTAPIGPRRPGTTVLRG